MRIGLMSDLHREFHPAPPRGSPRDAVGHEPFGPHGISLASLRGRCDVLVIPGDFDTGAKGAEALIAASEYLGVPIVYVPGNHEFYGQKIYKALRVLRARLAGSAVHLLDRGVATFTAGGVSARFLGATLWTDFALFGADKSELHMGLAQDRKNDFRRITVGPEDVGRPIYRRLLPRDTLGFHLRDLRWLRDRLEEPFDGRTVVVTHMAPSSRSVPPDIRGDHVATGDASNLEGFIEEMQPDAWLHGHTHMSSDYRIGRTRVVCNPYGYWGHEMNPDFRPDLAIELDEIEPQVRSSSSMEP